MEIFEFTAVTSLTWDWKWDGEKGTRYPSFDGSLGHAGVTRTSKGIYVHIKREGTCRDEAIAWAHEATKLAGGEVTEIIEPPPPGKLWSKKGGLYEDPTPHLMRRRVALEGMWEREKAERAAAEAERKAKEAERAAQKAAKEAERVAKMSPKARQRYELQKAREAKLVAIAVEAETPFANATQIVTILARRLGMSFDELIDKVEG